MSDAGASDVSLDIEVAKGLVAKIGMAVSGFTATVLFTHLLEPAELGAYFVLFSFVVVANRPVYGLANACKKRYSEVNGETPEIFGFLLLGFVIMTSLVTIAAFLLEPVIETYAQRPVEAAHFVGLFAALTLFHIVRIMIEATAKVSVTTWANFGRSLLAIALQVGLAWLGYGVAGLVGEMVVATLATTPVLFWYLGVRPRVPSAETRQSVMEFARYSIPSAVTWRIYDEFDILLIGAVVGAAASSYYGVAWRLTVPAAFIVTLLSSGLTSKVSNLDSKGEAVAETAERALSFSSLLALPLLFGVLAIAQPIVETAYSPDYAPAATFLALLAFYQVVRSQVSPIGSIIAGLDNPSIIFRGSVLALATNVVLGVALVYEVGAIGVVIATVVAELSRYGYYAQYVQRRLTGVPLLTTSFLRQLAAGGVMYLSVRGVWYVVGATGWLTVTATVVFGGVVYFAALLALDEPSRGIACRFLEAAPVFKQRVDG